MTHARTTRETTASDDDEDKKHWKDKRRIFVLVDCLCVCVDRREPQDWLPAPHTLLLILHHYTLQWLLHTAHRTLHTARPLQQRSLPARRAHFHTDTYLPYSTTACLHCVFVVQHPSKIPPKEDRLRAFCIPNYPPTHSLTHPPVNFLVSSSPRRAIHPRDPRPAIGPRCNHHIDRIVSCGPTWQRTRARYPLPSVVMVGAESLPSHCVWFAVCGRMSAYLPSSTYTLLRYLHYTTHPGLSAAAAGAGSFQRTNALV